METQGPRTDRKHYKKHKPKKQRYTDTTGHSQEKKKKGEEEGIQNCCSKYDIREGRAISNIMSRVCAQYISKVTLLGMSNCEGGAKSRDMVGWRTIDIMKETSTILLLD